SSLLSVFRAGAVYLPIDPRWPAVRGAQVVRESGAGVVLAPASLPAGIASDGRRVVETGGAEGAAERSAPIAEPEAPTSDVAYVLYTSGSTGTPKGAVI